MPRFALVEQAVEVKADGSVLTEADLAMQRRLREALAIHWPGIPLLGEEMGIEAQAAVLRCVGGAFWCLDPLDGTSNFAAGIPFFSTSLALVRDGEPLLGLVYDPVRDECFAAERGRGAWLNGVRLRPAPAPPLERSIALVDFKRLPAAFAQRLAGSPPYRSQRSFGSVALDWCWIAAGRGHVYLHGGQKLWDFAAGWLILREAGGRAATLDGEPVYRAALEPRSAVAARDAGLFREWCAWLGVEWPG